MHWCKNSVKNANMNCNVYMFLYHMCQHMYIYICICCTWVSNSAYFGNCKELKVPPHLPVVG